MGISQELLEFIIAEIGKISFGQVILTAQDKRLVQLEKIEKIRVSPKTGPDIQLTEKTPSQGQELLRRRIAQEFSQLSFGRLTIVVQNGNVVQLERTEKQRFTGMDGEGI